MNPHFFLLSLVGLSSLPALAQTPAAPPTNAVAPAKPSPLIMDPAARAIIERAITTYRDAKSIRYSFIKAKTGAVSTVRYLNPGLLRVDRELKGKTSRDLVNGADIYTVLGDEYRKSVNFYSGVSPLASGMAGEAGHFLAPMMEGKNPYEVMAEEYSQETDGEPIFKNFKMDVVGLGLRVVDGEVLQGVRSSYVLLLPGKGSPLTHKETTAWFGGSPFALRRVQTLTTFPGFSAANTEKITEQEVSPEFPADTFVFDATGLKFMSETAIKKSRGAPYDPRLKVGAAPFPIATNDLKGQPISLAKYKGKVVLLDFWATWCGPCVAGLPELKSAYNKYHAQGFEVVGISLDEEKGALTSFIKKNKMPWPQIFDGKGWDSKVSNDYGVRAIPFLLLIGRDGKIAAVNPRNELDKEVQAALAAR